VSGLDGLTRERFAATVGDTWELTFEQEGSDPVAVPLVLEEAVAVGGGAPGGAPAAAGGAPASGGSAPAPSAGNAAEAAPAPRQPFSLLFRGPAESVLPQATYPLQHAQLGTLAIFLVPISRGADGVRYEAVFA
jgi:hypothetical protein